MFSYALDHPAPATIILILGDREFKFNYAVSILRLRGYKVVLISNNCTHWKDHATLCLDWMGVAGKTDSANEHLRRRSSDAAPAASSVNGASSQQRHASMFTRESSLLQSSFVPSVSFESLKPADVAQVSKDTHSPRNGQQGSAGVSAVLPGAHGLGHSLLNGPGLAGLSISSPGISGGQQHSNRSSFGTCISETRPETLNRLVIARPESKSDLVAPVTKDMQTVAERHKALIASSFSVNQTTHPSRILEQDQTTQYSRHSDATTIPPEFLDMAQQLEMRRMNGDERPLRSKFAAELSPSLYKLAGVEKFKDYAALASQAGVVVLGGTGGYAWISLHRQWHGNVPRAS